MARWRQNIECLCSFRCSGDSLGLIVYGWAPEKRSVWIVTDVGAAIFLGGVMVSSNPIIAYLIDEFGDHAASANAASRMFSNVMGFTFPLFAPQLYR
jgi:hypothetical protein